jgi:uncharacterized membrane protein YoaK (UPF0700 family)
VFTSHVTGNLVLMGQELTRPAAGMAAKLVVFPAFVLGVACAGFAHAMLLARGRATVAPLLLAQGIALAAFLAFGWSATPIEPAHLGNALPLLAASSGAFAMGIQNAQARLTFAALGPTTVMTGNVTQLVLDGVAAARAPAPDRAATRAQLARHLGPVAGFAGGSIAGALACQAWSFGALVPPILLLCALAALTIGFPQRRHV